MAVKSQYTRFLLNEFDFSGYSNQLDVSIAGDKLEATAFQDTGKVYLTGVPDATLTQAGYFATDTGYIEDELKAAFDAGTCDAAALYGTNVTKCPAFVFPGAKVVSYGITTATGSVITINSELASGEGVKAGYRVFSGTISATGEQTSIDLGSAGSAGGHAYLFVQAITGSATDAAIKVQSSSDDSTFADEGTFTFSAVGVQAVTMSGTVNRYIRLNCTDLGGATNFTVVGIVAVSGVTM